MLARRILMAVALLVPLGACSAAEPTQPTYVDGNQYVTLEHPQRYSPKGKVEVVEVFSYGCVHCAQFEPYMEQLAASLPKGVVVHYVPAVFSRAWMPYAQAFYAARELGVRKATHAAVFKAKFDFHYPMNSLEDFASFYARHGVSRDAFLKAAQSATTRQQMESDFQLVRQWGVMGTPTIVVNGKYRVQHVRDFKQLVAVTRWLVQHELRKTADQDRKR